MQVSEYFSDQQRCIDFIREVRWNGDLKCAHCGHDKVYTLNGKNKRYKCAGCKKQFTIIKGTIFENSPIPLQKWFMAVYLLISRKKGISSVQLSKDIGVTQTTAWHMLQRIRFMLKESVTQKLTGLVAADETFVGGKNKNRHWDKKVKNSQGRSFKDKTPVVGLLELEDSYIIERPHKLIQGRTVNEKVITKPGKLVCKVVQNTRGKTIKPIVYSMVERGSIVVTDEWQAYEGLNGIYDHRIVNHKAQQYVDADGFTSNAVENAWSIFKRTIIGTYHKVSRRHIHRYVAEFVFRYNNRLLSKEDYYKAAFENFEKRILLANIKK